MYRKLVAAALLMVILIGAPGPVESGRTSQSPAVFSLKSFDGGLAQSAVRLRAGENDTSTAITFPPSSWILNASLRLGAFPFTEGVKDYPTGPKLDIGADGTVDWAFDGFAYGSMDYQQLFHDAASTFCGANLSLGANGSATLLSRVPANASLVDASLTVSGWPTPYWNDPVNVTPHDGSTGESSPAFFSFGGRLWVAWATRDRAIVDGTDWDIAVSWSTDGQSWAAPLDISPPGDGYQDDSPSIAGYGGNIYVSWSSALIESSFSPCNIFIRSWDGSRWGDTVRLTPPGWSYLNDWPQMEVFSDRLFVFWRTTDPRQARISDYEDMDIVHCSFNGQRWSSIGEVTPASDRTIDWSLRLEVFGGRLWCFWDQDTDSGPGFNMDIMCRAFDGAAWGSPQNIIDQPDSELDEIPKTCVYRDPVTGSDELWVSWIRGDPSSHSLHIMVRMYDGQSWGPSTELTDSSMPGDNMGVEMVEYDDCLYVVWVTGNNTTTEYGGSISIYSTFGHIVIRAFDGHGWSGAVELTPVGQEDNANSPTLAVYNDRLYAAWAFPYPVSQGGTETWDIIARNIDFVPVELGLDVAGASVPLWGPSALPSTNVTLPLSVEAFRQALANAARTVDRYGNEYCDIAISIHSAHPSKISLSGLGIEYSLTVRLDNITDDLNNILWNRTGRDGGGNTTIPFSFSASSQGGMRAGDLNISYIINLPPVFHGPIIDRHFPEDTDAVHLINLDDYFTDDWDAGNLAYVVTFEDAPQGVHAVLDGHHLTFTTPTENWNGAGHFRVRAYDRARLWAESNLFCITVDPVNDPPVLDPIPPMGVDVGAYVYFEVHATDVDGDLLSFSTDNASIDVAPLGERTGLGFVKFPALRRGTIRLNITVDDGHGGTDSKTAKIAVQAPVSSGASEPCLSFLVVMIIGAAAAAAAFWFRKRKLKEMGSVIGPAGEFTEEQVFGGLVAVDRTGGKIEGGTEENIPGR